MITRIHEQQAGLYLIRLSLVATWPLPLTRQRRDGGTAVSIQHDVVWNTHFCVNLIRGEVSDCQQGLLASGAQALTGLERNPMLY